MVCNSLKNYVPLLANWSCLYDKKMFFSGPAQINEKITSEEHSNKFEILSLQQKFEQLMNKQIENEKRITHLEEVLKTNVLRSCNEYASFGINANGYYHIDPDGQLIGSPPFQVYCRFINETGITEIDHDTEDLVEVNQCDGIACFKQMVNYSVPMEQLESLIGLSEECLQSISFGCYSAPLYSYVNDNQLGGWLDRNGK